MCGCRTRTCAWETKLLTACDPPLASSFASVWHCCPSPSPGSCPPKRSRRCSWRRAGRAAGWAGRGGSAVRMTLDGRRKRLRDAVAGDAVAGVLMIEGWERLGADCFRRKGRDR
jgi:hypothetical protein